MVAGMRLYAKGEENFDDGTAKAAAAARETPGAEATPKPAEPTDLGEIDDPPPAGSTEKPEKPKRGDLYPDPDGGADGSGNPARLPDRDGGGGNPTTIWDENGGGGDPTTIWDENGGGGNPTTTGQFMATTALTGRGLLAGVMQVVPSSFAF
jgi:hypothetical protein